MTIGELMAMRIELNRQLTEANKVVTELKAERNSIDRDLRAQLKAAGTDRAGFKGYTASVETKVGMTHDDWALTWDYIITNRATHLLSKQLIRSAVAEMHEAGERIPGTSTYEYEDLYFHKTS